MITIEPRDIKNVYSIISKNEFFITKTLLDMFEIDYDVNHEIIYDYSPIYINDNVCLAYSDNYLDFREISKNKNVILFRPMKIDKHANILIKMFENLDFIDFDTIEIDGTPGPNGKIKYKGCLIKNGQVIDGSYVKSAPSIQILKVSIVANMLMDENTHNEYYKNLLHFLHKKGHVWRHSN